MNFFSTPLLSLFLTSYLFPSLSLQDNEEAVRTLGMKFGEEMCRQLLQLGAPGLHFYTLNQPHPTKEILTALGFPAVAPVVDCL
jgi:5,10-methylenetetrahydrofolate reductase